MNNEIYNGDVFKFRQYEYGPFCDDVINMVTELDEKNLIREKPVSINGFMTGYKYSLTNKGKKIAEDIFQNKLSKREKKIFREYKDKFGHYSPSDLLMYVYQKFPFYIEKSMFKT